MQPLAWEKPTVLIPRTLRHDRIVIARVRNRSSQPLHLESARITVSDAAGRRLNATAGFTNSYAHGLFGAFQQPSALPHAELVRLGRVVDLAPGATAPFFAAWHLRPDSREPVTVDYGRGTLTVPRKTELAP